MRSAPANTGPAWRAFDHSAAQSITVSQIGAERMVRKMSSVRFGQPPKVVSYETTGAVASSRRRPASNASHSSAFCEPGEPFDPRGIWMSMANSEPLIEIKKIRPKFNARMTRFENISRFGLALSRGARATRRLRVDLPVETLDKVSLRSGRSTAETSRRPERFDYRICAAGG